uniref:Uncharacterized protein n=1 Tax=Salvator merianae TaxID=96440 RepID=A0A8D0C7A7_SALMN
MVIGAAKKLKKSLESILSRLQLFMKSGKDVLGYQQTLCRKASESDLAGQSQADNCPTLRKSETEDYAVLTKTAYVTIVEIIQESVLTNSKKKSTTALAMRQLTDGFPMGLFTCQSASSLLPSHEHSLGYKT